MDLAKALPIASRYVPDSGEAVRLLEETSSTRTVDGSERKLYDPYAASLAYLMHPDTLKSKTEGEVREDYIDSKELISYLKGMSAELRADWPLDDAASTLAPNLELNIVGWGR